MVHLLKCTTFGFGDEEEGPDAGEEAEGCEEDVCAVVRTVD